MGASPKALRLRSQQGGPPRPRTTTMQMRLTTLLLLAAAAMSIITCAGVPLAQDAIVPETTLQQSKTGSQESTAKDVDPLDAMRPALKAEGAKVAEDSDEAIGKEEAVGKGELERVEDTKGEEQSQYG